ncbi:helix-turn-helix transcriptional regulator [Agromyces sp. SYSU T00194]|uniref:helix-turn-helix transcriptional regulator n=1 Tax=Agromyces chitinivorans TaxID=3158560 RepID=UPI00339B8FFE
MSAHDGTIPTDPAAIGDAELDPGVGGVTHTEHSRVIVDVLCGIAEPLAAALGEDSEVVIHDLTLLPDTIVAVGGELTGRTAGGPITNLLLEHLKMGRTDDIIRYRASPADGRTFRSSTIFLRHPDGTPFASLCINTDLTQWNRARALIDAVLRTGEGETGAVEPEASGELFSNNVGELSEALIRRAIERIDVPPSLMQKQHKVAVVRDLDAQGFFLIRDAVDLAAQSLGVTRFTIYNYLNEIREE